MTDTSGPAFPISQVKTDRDGEVYSDVIDGMTLRDYFAAKSLDALIQQEFLDGSYQHVCPGSAHGIASVAYLIADAMLEARKS